MGRSVAPSPVTGRSSEARNLVTTRTAQPHGGQSTPPHAVTTKAAANELSASSADRLAASVVAGGYCIGCGACSAGKDSAFSMAFDRYGFLQAARTAPDPGDADYIALCPFPGSSSQGYDVSCSS